MIDVARRQVLDSKDHSRLLIRESKLRSRFPVEGQKTACDRLHGAIPDLDRDSPLSNEQSRAGLLLGQLRQRKVIGFLFQGCAPAEQNMGITVTFDLLLVIHKCCYRVQRAP